MMKMQWWARIAPAGEYGSWVPTGQDDLAEAEFYIETVYAGRRVAEWLLIV